MDTVEDRMDDLHQFVNDIILNSEPTWRPKECNAITSEAYIEWIQQNSETKLHIPRAPVMPQEMNPKHKIAAIQEYVASLPYRYTQLTKLSW
jgi:hypothetical protein